MRRQYNKLLERWTKGYDYLSSEQFYIDMAKDGTKDLEKHRAYLYWVYLTNELKKLEEELNRSTVK